MKRLSYILFAVVVALAVASCVKEDHLESDSIVVGGISDKTLIIGGREGATTTFTITTKYDWRIITPKGFECSPSQGSAGSNITVTATATQANNTIEAVYLGELVFKLKSTRFTGISVYQQPQIIVEYGYEKVYTEANAGASAIIKFTSNNPDFSIVPSEGLEYEFQQRDTQKGKYQIAVSSKGDNLSCEAVYIGDVAFFVDGVRQEGAVEVYQHPAIRVDKNRLLLSGQSGAKNSFTVITPFDFDIGFSSQSFSVEANDDKTVTVVANSDNPTDDDVVLGTVNISLASDGACAVSVEVVQRIAVAPQTILFHFIGTSLQTHYNNNIANAVSALDENIQGKSRVLVFIQSSTTSASLYELQYDPESGAGMKEKIKDYTLPAKYTEQMLADNLSDMITFAPAHHYGLIIGSHGKGWIPKAETNILSYNARMEDARKRIWTTVPDAPQMRHIGDSAATQFNCDEFAAAVEKTGVKMDYIIFDACFMSNIESVYDMRNTAEKIVASPCEVMGTGFPYKTVLPLLLADKGQTYDLDAVCRTFVDYYNTNSSTLYRSACSALIDCSQIEALARSVKRVNESKTKEFNLSDLQAYEGISSYYNPTHIFYDMGDYVRQSCDDESAVREFEEQMDRTISAKYHTDKFYSAYNGSANDINYYSGISTSAPIESDANSVYVEDWRKTGWYAATH